MMYSYLEEWLYHYWKIYIPDVEIGNSGSIGRFKTIVKRLGVDLTSKYWQNLTDTEEIRNCLLHANGRISLLRDPQKVKRIIDKKELELKIDSDRIIISGKYLYIFNDNIQKLLEIIHDLHTP
jgi:hypothetical protein